MDIKVIQEIVEEDGIVFLTYGGFLSQTLIAGMTEALENEAEIGELNKGIANNIFTIFIELSQNMMNYSKTKFQDCVDLKSQGLIVVGRNSNGSYYLHSQNIIDRQDRDKIEPIMSWMKQYFISPQEKTTIELEIIYFNSSSSKLFFDFFDLIEENRDKSDIEIRWIYDQENESALEAGEDFKEDFESLNFNLFSK